MIDAWFDRIRNVPILDVLSFLGHPYSSPNGKIQFRQPCILPSHSGPNKTKTALSINIYKNVWYCFGCQEGGGNIELVMRTQGSSVIESANFIASRCGIETFEEIKASTPEEKEAYKKALEEGILVSNILGVAAHFFHAQFVKKQREALLIPQGQFDPKETWGNIYDTWGITDQVIENQEILIGFDNGILLKELKNKNYSDKQILKSGLFYQNDNGEIGKSVFENRITFPYLENGRVVNFIARSTEKNWPCYKPNPSEELAKNKFPYAKYKKIPLHNEKSRPYVSKTIKSRFFGLSEIKKSKNALVVEGITDVILMRMFFDIMREAEIREASQWAVGSFAANQISNSQIQELASTSKNLDTLIFLCDTELSGRGIQGSVNTAKKLLPSGTQALIGILPRQEGQEKIDPALWLKKEQRRLQESPQELWDDFLKIVQSSRNVIEWKIDEAKQALSNPPSGVSLSYLERIKKEHMDQIINLISLLGDVEQTQYLKLLTESPFSYKLNPLKKLLKEKQETVSLLDSTQENKPKEQDTAFMVPGDIPEGWVMNSKGLYKECVTSSREVRYLKIAESPLAITERLCDIDVGQYYLKTAFYEEQEWKPRTESREIFMSARLVPGLAKWGFPTNTENAKDIVKFLTEYEAVNRNRLGTSQVVSSCGMKKVHDETAFILGKRCLFTNGKEETIEFLTPDAGDLQIVNAFESSGSMDQCKKILMDCLPYPGVMGAIYTSFANPFLRSLKSKGFTYHMWGRSSIGKTIALIIASSIWGDPVRLIQSWNQKEVATERRMAICNEVGIFLDELKQAIRKEDIERVLYSVANGYGRGRGSLKGQQKTLYWLLNLISTGEMPSTYVATDEGGQARVLNVRGRLFGEGKRDLVRSLELLAKKNYGYLGPCLIQNADMGNIQKSYNQYLLLLGKIAKSDIAYRIGNHLAVILAIGDEVNRLFGLTEKSAYELMEDLVKELLSDAGTIDRAKNALFEVQEWVLSNPSLFYPDAGSKIIKDIAGSIKKGEYVAFFPHRLRRVLEGFGYNYSAIISDWIERDWLRHDKGRTTFKVPVGKERTRMHVIDWRVLSTFSNE